MRSQEEPCTVDGYRDRLHRAGWSLGEFGHVSGWTVDAALRHGLRGLPGGTGLSDLLGRQRRKRT